LTSPSAARWFWIDEVKVMLLYLAVAFTFTGQPGLVTPVSTFNNR
jgi:hypothetical protein